MIHFGHGDKLNG